ncbi:MAG: DHH family phosphoesterase [Patescibacteria group bacterium]
MPVMKEFNQPFAKLNEYILASQNILLTTHEKPDGDAIGALLALAYYFSDLGKKYHCFSETRVIDPFYFLPGIEKVSQSIPDLKGFDLIIFLDAGDVKRTGIKDYLPQIEREKTKIVNIDHHLTTSLKAGHFFDLNIVDLEVSSTAEIIYNFFDFLNIPINKEKATNLLTGLLTDTGCFSNLGTTVSSFAIAAKLLNKGANIKKICDHTLKNKNIVSLKLWGRVLAGLEKNEKTGVVTSVITLKDVEECGADEESTEGISNFLNFLSEARFTLLLKEEKNGQVRGSLRTTREDVDVSRIAARFGGGGHKKAAGFSVKGRLRKTKDGWRIE